MTTIELEMAILKAEKESMKFKDYDDGGTCNFDTPIIKLPDGIKPKDVGGLEWKVEKIGGKFWKGWYFVFTDLRGQGNRRSKMAETVAKILKQEGIEAMVYYQMD